MAETLKNFFDRISDNAEPAFQAEPWYNPSGDCIHYHWCHDDFYRDFVDDKLTLYRSIATKDAVGCQIKGVTALLKKLGDFDISLNEKNDAPLVLFVFASQNTATGFNYEPKERQETYRYLVEQVGRQKIALPEPTAG